MSWQFDGYDFERDPLGIRDEVTFHEGRTWQGPQEEYVTNTAYALPSPESIARVEAELRALLETQDDLPIWDPKTFRTLHQRTGASYDDVCMAAYVVLDERTVAHYQ